MSKKPKASHEEVEQAAPEKLVKYATMVPKSIINGHVLTVGTVVELTEEEAANHRANGLPLDDVKDGDSREVYNVREMYVVPEGEG